MSKRAINEARFLSLLEGVLARTAPDTHTATRIYEAAAKEIRFITSLAALEAFCAKGSLPDAEEATLSGLCDQLGVNFGPENVTVTPNAEKTAVQIGITTPNEVWTASIAVRPPGEEEDVEVPWVPFPVALPGDEGLIWLLMRRENIGTDDAKLALLRLEEEFWASKRGHLLLRKGEEKGFAAFVEAVPASALKEIGIRRVHTSPEALTILLEV